MTTPFGGVSRKQGGRKMNSSLQNIMETQDVEMGSPRKNGVANSKLISPPTTSSDDPMSKSQGYPGPSPGRNERQSTRTKLREAFGELIYEIKEKSTGDTCCGCFGKCGNSDQLIVKFYEKVIIFQDESQILCYPPAYTQQIFPKYRVTGIAVSRAQIPTWVLKVGFLLWVIGFVLIGMAGEFEDQEDEMRDIGIALAVAVPVVILPLPYFLNKFEITLYFHKKLPIMERIFNSFVTGFGLFSGSGSADDAFPSVITISTTDKPDTDLLMEYVYGSLGSNMPEIHQLMHLVQDDLSLRVQPTKQWRDTKAPSMNSESFA
jgi:hypothetical protein